MFDFAKQGLGDRGATQAGPANAADVELSELRMTKHGVINGRHRHDLADTVRSDGPEVSVEVERV